MTSFRRKINRVVVVVESGMELEFFRKIKKKLQTLRRPLSMVGRERVERVGVGMEECSNPTPSEV